MIDVSDRPKITVTKEGPMKGDNGHIYDTEEWNGETFYIAHVYAPHDRTVELKESEFEKIS